jgi:hypothetical protein
LGEVTLLERARTTIQRRENRYQQQIEQLRVKIDEIKRQQQVSEIVNSDFFQGIQDKAREMRQQRAQAAETARPDDARWRALGDGSELPDKETTSRCFVALRHTN